MFKRRVVIAPDSFKGTIDAQGAAAAIGAGWRSVRPGDHVVLLPQADGGEGTLAALAGADPDARWEDAGPVPGPDGRAVPGRWLRLGDGRAAVELAAVCGLPLMESPDPLGASTQGLGAVLRSVARHGPGEILVGLGGSASTDGGLGLLAGLGARPLDAAGRLLPVGGAALIHLDRLDLAGLVRPGPLVVLSDVTTPLLGPEGAAAVFGPQKGAEPADVALLERGLTRLAEVIGVDPQQPGFGAAGGTAYALAAVLGARVEPGAPFVARITGLAKAALDTDVLITGEGHFDATSRRGKAVGHVLGLPGPRHRVLIAGGIDPGPSMVPGPTGRAGPGRAGWRAYSLTRLAGDPGGPLSDPARWLRAAGARAAADLGAELG